MNPHDIKMEYISKVFFYIIPKVENMWYFNAQQLALNHTADKRGINTTLHDDDKVMLEGDARDSTLWGLQRCWLQEDIVVGVTDGECCGTNMR